MTKAVLPVTLKTGFSRKRERALYERQSIYEILDASLLCHVAFVDNGTPIVLPTAYCRYNDHLIIHGAANGRFFNVLAAGCEVSVCVTLLDGIVLSRRAFNHSMNYRSVVMFGKFEPIEDETVKNDVLNALIEHIVPGRSRDNIIHSTRNELAATAVLALPIEEASAKVRSGPPKDKEDEHSQPVWAGVVPMRMVFGRPEADPTLTEHIELPDYIGRMALVEP